MAAPDVLEALRVPGELIVGPTVTTGGLPFGGTRLGLVRDVKLRVLEGRVNITAEELGVEVVDYVLTGSDYRLAFALRGWDADAWGQVFPNTTLGALGGQTGVVAPGPVEPGRLGSSRAVQLLFAPDDTARHPAVYFPAAIPLAAESQEVSVTRQNEFLVLAAFHATRDGHGTGRLAQVQLIEDLTL